MANLEDPEVVHLKNVLYNSLINKLSKLHFTSKMELGTKCAYSVVTYKLSTSTDVLDDEAMSSSMYLLLSLWLLELFISSRMEGLQLDRDSIQHNIVNNYIHKMKENKRCEFTKFYELLHSKSKKKHTPPNRVIITQLGQVREIFCHRLYASISGPKRHEVGVPEPKTKLAWTDELIEVYYPSTSWVRIYSLNL